MQIVEQFFCPERKGSPYEQEEDALEDLLCLVDVYVNLAAWGRDEVGERLDMRGVVILPQEFRQALAERSLRWQSPQEAGADGKAGHSQVQPEDRRWVMQERKHQILKAHEHVEGRLLATKATGWTPRFCQLAEAAGLDGAERLCFYLAAALEYDRKYERIYGYLQDNVAAKQPTLGLGLSLLALREGWSNPAARALRLMDRTGSPLWRLLLEDASHEEGTSRLSCPMSLREEILAWLTGVEKRELAVVLRDIKCSAQKARGGDSIGGCAYRVPQGYEWGDLILETVQKQLLRQLCSRVQCRQIVMEQWGFGEKSPYGNGISAVFYGPPGTGKTMAAQVLARELGRELYKIDLSRLVSKYIGETEKNLGEVFDHARTMEAILFFDEADSLFAKRSEISGSNDRYANMETGYLLQKMEEYDGIVVLATNLITNMDEAFKRRIRYFIRFSMPDAGMRLKLWNHLFPEKTPRDEPLELECYAREHELAGSDIKEIVTSAAYLAAASKRGVTNRDIRQAMQIHYMKLGMGVDMTDWSSREEGKPEEAIR